MFGFIPSPFFDHYSVGDAQPVTCRQPELFPTPSILYRKLDEVNHQFRIWLKISGC
jgi:hypothetical protein